jgi:hypothetical protein
MELSLNSRDLRELEVTCDQRIRLSWLGNAGLMTQRSLVKSSPRNEQDRG